MATKEKRKRKKPAIFLDRDGVLTVEESYVTSVENLHIFPYAEECIRQIHNKGYYAIVVTNQSGVARGLFTEENLREMNHFLISRTGVDAVFYCPHHPEGKIEKYKKICRCRKPKAGMLEMACQKFEIDLEKSYMVGDRSGDILAGIEMGIKTVLLESGYGVQEQYVRADYKLKNLKSFVELLDAGGF